MWSKAFLVVFSASVCVFSQTKEAYNQTQDSLKGGIFDASRFSIRHTLSFGMGTAAGSSMQSQGLYSTLLTYQFSQPLTLRANFGFPLFSTFSPFSTPNQKNLSSMDYFRNMPIDVSLSWKPTQNLYFQLNVVRNPQYDYFSGMMYPFYTRSMLEAHEAESISNK